MVEFTTSIYEEYTGDVEIDFSTLSEERIEELKKAIQQKGRFTFRDVGLVFSGDVTVGVMDIVVHFESS